MFGSKLAEISEKLSSWMPGRLSDLGGLVKRYRFFISHELQARPLHRLAAVLLGHVDVDLRRLDILVPEPLLQLEGGDLAALRLHRGEGVPEDVRADLLRPARTVCGTPAAR